MTMINPSISSLSTDIKLIIAENIWETDPDSINSLSLVDRNWNWICQPFVHRNLTIRVDDHGEFIPDIEKFLNDHHRVAVLKYTRILSITGSRIPYKQGGSSEEISDEGYGFQEAGETSSVETAGWQPLITFISKLQHLTNLSYSCSAPFPLTLLGVLKRECKIFITAHEIQHIVPTEPPQQTNWALLQSPQLKGLTIDCAWGDADSSNYEADSQYLLILKTAANLEFLEINFFYDEFNHETTLRKQIFDACSKFVLPNQLLKLKEWRVYGSGYIYAGTFDMWTKTIDFSTLTALTLDRKISSDGIEELRCIVDLFQSLKSFGLFVDFSDEDTDCPMAAAVLIYELPRLEILSLNGALTPDILYTIGMTHGETLKNLTFTPTLQHLDGDNRTFFYMRLCHFKDIQESCPRLTFLKITFKRSFSELFETLCYETLGKLENLTHLIVDMDCTDRRHSFSDAEHWDEELQAYCHYPLRVGHVGQCLIKSAIDEKFAQRIWDLVRGPRLTVLRIRPFGAGVFGPFRADIGLKIILDHICRRMTVVKNYDGDDVSIREEDRAEREDTDFLLRDNELRHFSVDSGQFLDSYYSSAFKVFKMLWPMDDPSTDWRDAWESFPPLPSSSYEYEESSSSSE